MDLCIVESVVIMTTRIIVIIAIGKKAIIKKVSRCERKHIHDAILKIIGWRICNKPYIFFSNFDND